MTGLSGSIGSIKSVGYAIKAVIYPIGWHESIDILDMIHALFVWPRHILRVDDMNILRPAASRFHPSWHGAAVCPLIVSFRLVRP